MTEHIDKPGFCLSKYRLLLVPALLVLAVTVGAVRYWYVMQTAPKRHFQAALEALSHNDLDRIRVASEAIYGLAAYEPHWHLLWGMVLLREGHPIDAIVEFGHCREHPDTQALAYTLSGEALYKTHQLKDACKILGMAVQLDPAQTDAHRWLAATYYDIGAMDDALKELDVVAKQAPTDSRPHRLRGLIFKDFEQYPNAIDAYRESLNRDPNQPDKHAVLLELAECLVEQREHQAALKTLQQCPRSAQHLYLQSECYRLSGDSASAMDAANQAIQLEPGHLGALQLKGMLELEAGDAAAAVDVLTTAVQYHPKQWRPRYPLAMAYKRLGEDDKSEAQLKIMEELRSLRDHFTGLHAQAIENIEDANLRYELGVTAKQLDKPLLAASWFEAAIAMDPDHHEAQKALSELQAAAFESDGQLEP